MSTAAYDPTLPTDLDRMRDILGDTTEPYLAPDETYLARLVEANGNWKLAAASMARSFAARAINSPTSFTATGDMSISWTDRAAMWLKIAEALEQEVAEDGSSSNFWTARVYRADLEDDRSEYSRELKTNRGSSW